MQTTNNRVSDTVNDTVNELDKLAEKTFKGDDANTFVQREIWKDGYRKAKETLYTEEQVREILDHLIDKMNSITQEQIDKEPFQLGRYRTFKYVFDFILESLKQPKKD
jgi:hypothetical protein